MSEITPEAENLKQALIELEEIEAEFKRRRKTKGIQYFCPNEPQLKSLQSPANVVIYSGGNRAGKSTKGAMEMVCHLLRQYPSCKCHGEWFSARRRFTSPIKCVVSATEFPVIERVIEPKIMSLIPSDYIAKNGIKRTPQGYLRRLLCVDGSSVDLLTAEMDQMAYESADWDYAWIDEPLNRSKYVAIQRGLLDRNGFLTMTFTPLMEPWIKDELIDKADGKNIDVIEADTYANIVDIHGSPILSKEGIQRFEESVPEEERETRIYGKFFHLRGVVYKEFAPLIHCRDWKYEYPDPVICVLDPHDRKKHHVIWAFVDKNDWLYVDSELVMNGTVQELKQQILLREARNNYKVRKRIVDPNFSRKPLITTGKTLQQEMASSPFACPFVDANDDKETGRLKVKDYLHFDRTKQLGLTNSPRLFLHKDKCPLTIKSLRNYQYDEWKPGLRGEKDPKEMEKQFDTDGADVVRYLCMENAKYDSPYRGARNYELEGSPY